jgi:hypothetical protein
MKHINCHHQNILRSRKLFTIVPVVAILALLSPLPSSAAVIYQDSFARIGDLNGTAPDVVDTGAATWTATLHQYGRDNFATNGSAAVSAGIPTAFLPLTLDLTSIYTLTLTVNNPVSNGNNWLALGFLAGHPNDISGGFNGGSNAPSPWVLQTGNGGAQGFSPGFGGTSVTPGLDHTYTITLDSATGASSISVDGGLAFASGTLSSTQLSSISGVGFGSNFAEGSTFRNFILTDNVVVAAVPEPSTWAMVLGGFGMLVFFQRMRRTYTNS